MSNPFEVRLEVLKMAKDYMDKQYEVNTEFARKAMEQWKESGKDVQEFLTEITPKQYQPQELLEKAKEMYAFVSERK